MPLSAIMNSGSSPLNVVLLLPFSKLEKFSLDEFNIPCAWVTISLLWVPHGTFCNSLHSSIKFLYITPGGQFLKFSIFTHFGLFLFIIYKSHKTPCGRSIFFSSTPIRQPYTLYFRPYRPHLLASTCGELEILFYNCLILKCF